jgi:hypothetical protein
MKTTSDGSNLLLGNLKSPPFAWHTGFNTKGWLTLTGTNLIRDVAAWTKVRLTASPTAFPCRMASHSTMACANKYDIANGVSKSIESKYATLVGGMTPLPRQAHGLAMIATAKCALP